MDRGNPDVLLDIGLLKFSTEPSDLLPLDVVEVTLDLFGRELDDPSYLI